MVCLGKDGSTCLDQFEFFMVNNLTFNASIDLQKTEGVIGLAPDISSNGISFINALKKKGLIDYSRIGIRMIAQGDGTSKITLGGVDKDLMLPYPSEADKKIYYYENLHNDLEWGSEVRNVLVCDPAGRVSIDNGYKTYAKVDTFSPYI